MALPIEATATIIFGVLGTILALVGIILSAKYATKICKLDLRSSRFSVRDQMADLCFPATSASGRSTDIDLERNLVRSGSTTSSNNSTSDSISLSANNTNVSNST